MKVQRLLLLKLLQLLALVWKRFQRQRIRGQPLAEGYIGYRKPSVPGRAQAGTIGPVRCRSRPQREIVRPILHERVRSLQPGHKTCCLREQAVESLLVANNG
jgi:hypothetical protein